MSEIDRLISCAEDSSQISTLPKWVRDEFEKCADALIELQGKLKAAEERLRMAREGEPVAWFSPSFGLPYGFSEEPPTEDAVYLYLSKINETP